MKAIYLLIHLFAISYPLAQSFEHRLKYATKWKFLFPGIIITATLFVVWDIIFTKNGVWGFNEDYTLGINLFFLPIEEWLFFITIPFASVFIYECVIYFFPKITTHTRFKYFGIALALTAIITAAFNPDKLYTFWCFLLSGSYLMWVSLKNPQWLGIFFTTYFIHLIPFLLVNGILTGSWIDEPVVWYNNDHNLGIRIFTIPIEDTMYALLLLVLNISWYEYFKKSETIRT